MAEISYKDIDAHLVKTEPYSVYLLFGDEALYKDIEQKLVQALLGKENARHQYQPLDGAPENIPLAIEKLNTFSLLGGGQIVGLRDAVIFSSRRNGVDILEKAQRAFEDDQPRRAGRLLLECMAMYRLDGQDLTDTDGLKGVEPQLRKILKSAWVEPVWRFCEENGLKPNANQTTGPHLLEDALGRPFASGNRLIVTTDIIDKRRTLFKAFKKAGLVVDCSIPKTDSRQDKLARDQVLKQRAMQVLAGHGKRLEPAAYQAIIDRVGAQMRPFVVALETLVDFTADRPAITAADVAAVIKRTRTDPLYELTNALQERQTARALSMAQALITDGFHPLQLLAAIANQVRRLLIMKSFTVQSLGDRRFAGLTVAQFNQSILPQMQAADRQLLDAVAEWRDKLMPETQAPAGKNKPKAAQTDLVMVKNPRSSYPVYKLFLNCQRHDLKHLLECIHRIQQTDQQLKTGDSAPVLLLEKLLLFVCQH